MLDLQPIKDRLAAATPGPWNDDKTQLVLNAPADLAALVAEVERLRGAIAAHQKTGRRMSNNPHDRDLWAVLDA